jgi:hypothetical protein
MELFAGDLRISTRKTKAFMTEIQMIDSAQIHSLLAERGYDVEDAAPNALSIRQPESGITIQAVLEGDILFLSLPCLTVPDSKLTRDILRRMLAAENGISTSSFQLYGGNNGQTTIALSNFCKLQELGPDDQDDILSCIHFLFADVLAARTLLADVA